MPDIENKVMIHCVRREAAQACSRRLEHTLFEEANAGMTQSYERYTLLATTDHRTDQPSVRTVGSLRWPNNFFSSNPPSVHLKTSAKAFKLR